jgi:ribosomal protein S8
MDTIRDHDYVILLISDAYLKSINCMYEVIQFIQEKKYIEKTFPIIIDKQVDIFNKVKHIDYISFWQNKYKRFRNKINKLENTGTAQSHVELDKIDRIQSNIGEFLNKIADLKCFPLDELESTNYKAILDKIGNTLGVFQKEEIEVESEKLKLRIIGCLYKWYVEGLERGITLEFNTKEKINEWKISSKLVHKVIDEMLDDGYIERSTFGHVILTKQGRLLARKAKLEHKYDYEQCGKGD